MLEVESLVSVAVQPPEVAEAATKPLPTPLQKHTLGGCTIDMPPVELPSFSRAVYLVSFGYLNNARVAHNTESGKYTNSRYMGPTHMYTEGATN